MKDSFHTWIDKNKPIEHRVSVPGLAGMVFQCERADLAAPVVVILTEPLHKFPVASIAAGVTQFAAWHALNIFPHLNGFRGYACVRYEFQ